MKSKKGYPRKPYSFERVLKDLADDIGYDSIETVIEKKRKAIEHISNPNFKDRQLHIQDGLELDIHCKKLGKGTPFLTAYETLLRKEIAKQKDHGSSDEIIDNLLRLGESIGDIMEETRNALDDDKVDEDEKEQISIEVIELEKKIAELKLKLNLGDKTDYKSQKKRDF
ncbi:hypothetical protein N9N51_04545 [Candidatus Pelagibacter bacterium]|nr:hypothetical protein [Candidatus Pelagibacter bacterium]MDA8833880.1 hypothetical protein [Candidatus Pelagibacter bacterium]